MRLLLLITVTCAGAAVMIVEMTAVRALQPFFGSTTWVWANVIAVVLASLSVGYAVGGRLADRFPSPRLLFGLLAGGGILLALAAVAVRPVADLFLTRATDIEGVTTIFVKGSLGATLILFAPATLLLGTISPIAIRILSDRGVGRAAGTVFALGTAGSIAGTYLPLVLLVPYLGSQGSILVAAGFLILPAVAGMQLTRRLRGAALVLLLCAGVGGLTVLTGGAPIRAAPDLGGGATSTVLREVESEYQFLTVREDRMPDGTIHDVLTVNEGIHAAQSFRVRGKVLTGNRYYDDYALLPLLLDVPQGEELRACIVGLAAGVMAVQWRHFWEGPWRLRVDGAEIDPEVIALGREFFGLPGPEAEWLRVFPMDGRQLLARLPNEHTYHMIVVDAFANELYHPFHLGTIEFFRLCRERLEPGGILAVNVPSHYPDAGDLQALEQTLAAAFQGCLRVRQPERASYMLLALRGETTPELARLSAPRLRERFGDRPEHPGVERTREPGPVAAGTDRPGLAPRRSAPAYRRPRPAREPDRSFPPPKRVGGAAMRCMAATVLVLALLASLGIAGERADMIAAARDAMDRLPHHEGNARAGGLLARALDIDSSDADGGFTLAMRLRERILREFDFNAGYSFLGELARHHPHDAAIYRTERAWLCVNAGRSDLGVGMYAAVLAESPDSVEVALALADVHELRGHTAKALSVLRDITRRTDAPLAHLFHGRYLLRQGGDMSAIAAVLNAARSSAVDLPPGERDAFLAEVTREEESLRAVDRRRDEVGEHVHRVDRILLVTGAGWLVLLVSGLWFLRRRGWL